MTPVIQEAAERLRACGIESPRAEARILWGHAEARGISFESLLRRRQAKEPVAYITGHKEFWSLDFEVGPGVLIPRPETETLVEAALRDGPSRQRPHRVLDLGTGSGCLLIALLKELPDAIGCGVDCSPQALRWTAANLAGHGLVGRAELVEGSWEIVHGDFDLIVSNPPYVPTGELAGLPADVGGYEPTTALNGGADGLDAYRAIARRLPKLLRPYGRAFLEIGAGQQHAVRETLEAQGLVVSGITPDLSGIPRCIEIRHGGGV